MDRIKQSAAQYIWQSREELGIEGDSCGDWTLAEDFLCERGNHHFSYDIVFDWVQQKFEERL